ILRSLPSMRFAIAELPLTGNLAEAPEQTGDEVESHDDDDERERRAPHTVDGVVVDRPASERAVVAEVVHLGVDHAGQRALEVLAEQVGVEVVVVADEDQQRSGLAGYPGDAEHDAGDDAGQCGGHDDPHDGLPLQHAKGVGRFAQFVRDELEHLLGRAHDHRNHEQYEREPDEPATARSVERRDERGVDEQRGDDGRDAAEDVDHECRRASQRPATVLDQVDTDHQRDRHRDQRAQRDLLGGADDRMQRAAARVAERPGADVGREPAAPGECVPALADHGPEQPDQRDQSDAEGQGDENRGDVVLRPAQAVSGGGGQRGDRAHAVNSLRRLTTLRAAALTANVSTNSTRPAAMKAPVRLGSLNSAALLAIFDANVSPPLKIEKEKGAPLPRLDRMSITAIVSPSARPRPSIAPLIKPGRPCGSTASRIISQRVAPSAQAASMFSVGVRSKTSRPIAVTIGKIITASTTPPLKIVPRSTFSSLNTWKPPRW